MALAFLVEGAAAVDHPGVGAVGDGQINLFLGGAGRDDPGASRLAKLNRREADPAGRAEDQPGLAGLQVTAVVDGVIGGAIGQDEGGGLIIGHGIRNLGQPACRADDLLGHAAAADLGQNPVADLDAGDVVSDSLHDTRDLATRSKGPGRLGLVLVLDHQDVGEIDPDGLHRNDGAARLQFGRGGVLIDQGLRAAGHLAQNGLHICFSPVFFWVVEVRADASPQANAAEEVSRTFV